MINEIQNPSEIKQNIIKFENALLQLPEEQKIELEVKHYHANGVYAREMHLPINTMLSGAIHKYDHICILQKGKIAVVDEFNGKTELTAPEIFISKAGVKRAIFAVEESIFITCHLCKETEEDKIWQQLVSKTYQDYNMFLEQEKLKLEVNT